LNHPVNDEFGEAGESPMDRELKAKLDAVFALRWAGSLVSIHEDFFWEWADRPNRRARLASYLQMPLESIGLALGNGTVEFSFRVANAWVSYGVMIDRLIAIEFESDDSLQFIEEIGQQGWRRTRVKRMPPHYQEAEP
jgi:hypothetical protein